MRSWLVVLIAGFCMPFSQGQQRGPWIQETDKDLVWVSGAGQGAREVRVTNCRCVSHFDLDGESVAYVDNSARNSDGSVRSVAKVYDLKKGAVTFELPSPVKLVDRTYGGPYAGIALDISNQRMFVLLAGDTKHDLIRVDLRSGVVQQIGYAVSINLVRHGKNKGNLVALLRKSKLTPGYWYGFFLIDPEGKELGYVGLSEGNLIEFLYLAALEEQ